MREGEDVDEVYDCVEDRTKDDVDLEGVGEVASAHVADDDDSQQSADRSAERTSRIG